METILYATNCSKYDAETLRYAYELNNTLKTKLIVLHVYDIPPIIVSTIRPRKLLQNAAHDENLEVLKQYCSKHLKDTPKKTNIKFEVQEEVSVSEGILSKIKEISPDILLVGMKDEHTERGLFSRSIAKALIEKVNCPLLIVPHTKSFKEIKTMAYATDYEQDDIYALKKLVEIAAPSNAKIIVVHIPTKNEYAGEDQMEWFKEMLYQKITYKNIGFEIINHDTAYEGLRTYISTHKIELIAMLEREDRSLLKTLFYQDLIKKMESNITIPMLSFNNRNL